WMAQWMPKLTSGDKPLSPYRVIWDLLHTVDVANPIITHDAGSPRDQLSPFWESTHPLTYIGWGKTTQLGYGLGLAMGAKLARPEAPRINVGGGAQARPAGGALHQWWGRRGHRLHRHGLRDRGARAHPDPVDPAQQLLDGDRAADHEDRHREVPLHRHQRPLRGHGQGLRRLRRAYQRARRDHPRDQARHRQDPRGRAGAARVHHRERDQLLDLQVSASPPLSTLSPPGRGQGE